MHVRLRHTCIQDQDPSLTFGVYGSSEQGQTPELCGNGLHLAGGMFAAIIATGGTTSGASNDATACKQSAQGELHEELDQLLQWSY